MRVLMINVVCGIRSTGKICTDLASALEERGDEVRIAYGRESVPDVYQKYAVRIGTDLDVKLHGLRARLFDGCGRGSKKATRKFIEWVKEYDPDIIHLHNLHGYYLNVELLFDFLKKINRPVVMSLYDCWTFTGHCAHYDYHNCDKWKSGCGGCSFASEYPKALIPYSKRNWKNKKKWFSGLQNMSIIAPSDWMRRQVEESFLKDYPIFVFPNGIDLDSFQHKETDLRKEYGVEQKFVVLGVSSFWTKEKGIDYFNMISDRLDPEKFAVILVGNVNADTKVSDRIIKAGSSTELDKFYSAADVFVNPTLQETQGLTTVEALACGTPAVVFNSGGAAECISDNCGIVVDCGDIDGLIAAIESIETGSKVFARSDCRKKAADYERNKVCLPFVDLYDRLDSMKNYQRKDKTE